MVLFGLGKQPFDLPHSAQPPRKNGLSDHALALGIARLDRKTSNKSHLEFELMSEQRPAFNCLHQQMLIY